MQRLLLALLLVAMLVAVAACTALNPPTATPVPAPTAPGKPAVSGKPQLTPGKGATPVVKAGGKGTNLPPPASQTKQAGAAASSKTTCPALAAAQTKPSGYIKSITMAQDYDDGDAVNPTTVFKPTATIYAVLEIQSAPAKTSFRAVWYINDIGDAAYCNRKIGEFEQVTPASGTVSGHASFYQEPDTSWPVGAYRVEIYTNNTLDQLATYAVR